jgi:hypothetical protein
LAVGQFERQLLAHRGQQTVALGRSNGAGFAQFPEAPPHQGPLQPDGLVKREPGLGALAFGGVLREVDRTQRLILADQIPLLQGGFR